LARSIADQRGIDAGAITGRDLAIRARRSTTVATVITERFAVQGRVTEVISEPALPDAGLLTAHELIISADDLTVPAVKVGLLTLKYRVTGSVSYQ